MITQLMLDVQMRDAATFANFYVGDNQNLIACLQKLIAKNESFVYLWGASGSGRTHLLQACCHRVTEQELSVIYLSFNTITNLSPQILENVENLSLVCFDDVEKIAGNKIWEEALFHSFNRMRQAGTRLLIAGNAAPTNLPLTLADLSSRLSSGVTFQIKALTDEQKISALQMRAKIRGMNLPRNAAEFLLRRYQRDTNDLFNILEKLDKISLAEQHKLTIPFIKTVLN